jgi:RNAse (barnase) inhibitor barstar
MDISGEDSPPLLQLLPLVSESGAYRLPPELVDDLVESGTALGLSCHRIDLRDCRDPATLFERIAQALDFPPWFGQNWDALSDCLADLGWLGEAAGFVLVFDQAQDLRREAQDSYDTLVEILDEAADGWREVDLPFWSFLCEHETAPTNLPSR